MKKIDVGGTEAVLCLPMNYVVRMKEDKKCETVGRKKFVCFIYINERDVIGVM